MIRKTAGIDETFRIDRTLSDPDEYRRLKAAILEAVRSDFGCRRERVLVTWKDGGFEMSAANLLTNLILLRPFATFGRPFDPAFLFDCGSGSKGAYAKYFDRINDLFVDEDYVSLQDDIARVVEEIADVSGEFNVLRGNTISIQGVLALAEDVPELGELLDTRIPEGKQFDEIEDFLKERQQRLIHILKTEPNILRDYLLSGTGINPNQLAQTLVSIGLKPDLWGNIVPYPVDTSFLRGLRGVRDFYTVALGARKSLIMNFKQVKESGYLTRKLSLLTVDSSLHYEVEDCGSRHLLQVRVRTDDVLARLAGRWRCGEDDELVQISRGDTHLVGQDVLLRGPVTCALPLGQCCRRCYGDVLAKLNMDVNIGILATLILTSQLTQQLLSSKHLLQTNTMKVEWGKEFLELFTVDKNMVFLSPVDSKVTLLIDVEMIQVDEEADTSTISQFQVRKGRGTPVAVRTDIDLIITDEMMKAIKEYRRADGVSTIPVGSLFMEGPAFTIVMENNELSASLRAILELIETNGHLGIEDVDGMLDRFLELLGESGIHCDSTHVEVILRALVRDPENLTVFPDWSGEECPPYRVLRVTDAVLHSPSVVPGMSFEQIKRQLADPATYDKNGESALDSLF
jgi:hypothetical protein